MDSSNQIPGCPPDWAIGKPYVELTSQEYCTLKRMSPTTFLSQARSKRIPGLRKEGRRYRVVMNLSAAPKP